MAITRGRPDGSIDGSFFDQLDADSRAALLANGRSRTYRANSYLFLEGDDANNVFVIRGGSVKLSITLDGHEVVLDVLEAGDVLGELAVIDGQPRSATATAMTTVEVSCIPAPVFMAMVTDHPPICRALLRSVAARLRHASRRQAEYGALDAVGRVCRRLVEMVDRYGRRSPLGIRIDGPLNQTDIAAWAGLSREAVVKAMQTLRRLGWVHTSARSITILDVPAITARAFLPRG